MLKISHLVYPNYFTNNELVTFFKVATDYTTAFIAANTDDRPVIEMQSFDASPLEPYNTDLIGKYGTYCNILEIPRKNILSDEIFLRNNNRIKYVGDIKKVVKLSYDNTQSKGSEIIWNLIRDYKNFRKRTMDQVTGEITKLLGALSIEANIAYCTEIKIDSLVTKLKEENEKFETLYKNRGISNEVNKKNSIPAKRDCIASFYALVEYINSSIISGNMSSYDNLVIQLNSIIEPYNAKIRSKMKNKKDDDRPVIQFTKKKKEKKENDPEKKPM